MSEIIDITINVSDISAQLSQARREQTGFKEDLQSMPDMHEAFGGGIERTLATVDLLEKKIEDYNSSTGTTRDRITQDLLSGIKDVNVSTRMFSQNGSFAVSLAKQMFNGLSAAAQSELNKSTAEIARMITSALSTIKSRSVAGMAREILTSADAQKLFETKIKPGTVSSAEYEKYISALLPNVVPMHLLSEYQTARHGSFNRNNVTPSLATLIPNSYQSSYKARAYQENRISEAQSSELLRPEQRNIIKAEIMRNDAAARAARNVSGMTKRNSQNELMLSRNITRGQFEQFRRNLWDDYVIRAGGRASDRIDIFDSNLSEEDRRKAYARMSSSSAGKVLQAMRTADLIESNEAWGAAQDKRGYERLRKEDARSLEQYEIAKYTFEGVMNGKAPSRILISESPNTRALGMSGTHNSFSDKVVEFSFKGYDKTNPAHVSSVEDLIHGRPISQPGSDKRYIAQNMHGTGEDVVYRLVEENAYNDVMQREIAWMKSEGLISDEPGKGLSGQNYWNNFVPALYDFSSSKNLRRHYDATGKGWTPGSNIEANQQNKNFGIIDMSRLDEEKVSKLADGLAWVTSGILPRGSIQGRFALGGKGTIHQINHNTQGDWALSAGLINEGERFILPGPNGDVDLTDLHGMFDVSTVKNMQAYSNFETPDEQNTAFTKLMRRYNMSSMTTYDDSETRAKGLGAQAAMFMRIPQSMQEAQVKEYQKRMRLLDEEAGIRELLFGSEDNILGERLRSNEINVANPLIQYMVSKEKESLQRRALAGEFIDFSDEGMAVNQKVNKNPLTAIVELSELSRKDRIAKLRELMTTKGLTNTYTDDEIAGIWGLGGIEGGAVVDFSRMDEQLVGLQRSPNGFGQFVYGKNYAAQAKDVFNKFGISAQGVYLSEEDMFTLGDADFDGDGVKTLYGDQAIAVRDTAIEHAKLKARVPNVQQASETMVESMEGVTTFIDSGKQRRLALDDAIAAGMAMGLTSGAGEKAAQFDLSDPAHMDMLLAAIQSDRAYSLATASAKNATRVNLTPQMLATNALGRKWQFLPSKFSRLFNVTGQDNLDVPDEADIFTASNGLKINMDELRKLQLDRINLPSVNQDSVMMGLRSAVSMGPTGNSINQMNAVLEALDKDIGYGALGPNAQNLLKNMRAIKLQTNAGLRGMQTEDEELLLQQQIVAARQEIFKQADDASIGKTGMVKLADGTEMSRANYVNAALRAANVDIAQNHQEQFGVTKGRLQHKFGDNFGEYLFALRPSAISTQPISAAEVPPSVGARLAAVNPHRRVEDASDKQAERDSLNQAESNKRTESPYKYIDSQPVASVSDSFVDKSSHSMMEYLSKLEADIKENGMPEDVAAARFAKWYTDTIPASEDPFVMSDADAQRIVQQFTSTGKLPASMKVSNEDHALSGDGGSLIMRDLNLLRSIEGSRGLYEDLISSMRETSSKWYGMSIKQNEDPESVFYARSLREIKNAELRYQNAMTHGDQEVLGPGTAAGMDLANQQSWMQSNYFAATRAHLTSSGENVFETLRKSVAGTGDEFDKQIAKLNTWADAVAKLEKQLAAFENARKEREAESKIDETDDKKAIAEQKQRIEEAKKLQAKGTVDLLSSNDQDFADRIASIDEQVTGKIASPEIKISRTVDAYRKQIENIKADIQEAFDKGLLSQSDYANRMNDANLVGEYIDNNLQDNLTRRLQEEERILLKRTQRQEAQLQRRARRLMRDPYGIRSNGFLGRALDGRENRVDQFDVLTATYSEQIDKKTKELGKYVAGSDEYKKAAAEVENLKRQLAGAESAAKKLEGAGGAVGAVMAEVGQRVSSVVSQFGRQMFQKAAQEAKRFVQEFDAAMTEIQMITGKTDAEMNRLGGELIQTAIDMKVGVSDITSAASDLYRQGLEDEDVDVRMEDVQKFSKVANIKSAEASKIITTALSNDLVESSGEAMDALVALGDSAATTASEIAKGMQKSAASAKQAGVSYEQLVTMLTIITSKTQLGGNQAGTALQTLMYRLYRVNEGEDFYDENGNRIAANKASKALDQQGVSIYDDDGRPRGAYDIMIDIAKNWEGANNISQEMVLNALGAGRQRSNIATLIQGLAEDNGALAEKYIGLAENSEGVTDQKYLAYLDSLNASLTAVQSSFDQLIASFSISNEATAVLDFVSEFIQGLAAAEEHTGLLTKAIVVLGAALAAVAIVSNPIASLAALTVGGVQYATSQYGHRAAQQSRTMSDISADNQEATNRYTDYTTMIKDTEIILQKEVLSDLDIETVQNTLDAQSSEFGTATIEFSGAADEIRTAASLLKQANSIIDQEYKDRIESQWRDTFNNANADVAQVYTSSSDTRKNLDTLFGTNYSGNAYQYYNRHGVQVSMAGIPMGEAPTRAEEFTRFSSQDYMSEAERSEFKWSTASFDDNLSYSMSAAFDDYIKSMVDAGVMQSEAFPDIALKSRGAEAMITLATTEYEDLYKSPHSALFKTYYGNNEEQYYQDRMAFIDYMINQWMGSNGSVEAISSNNMSAVKEIVDTYVGAMTTAHLDQSAVQRMSEQFMSNLQYNGFFNAENDSDANTVFANELRLLKDSQFDAQGQLDDQGWFERYAAPHWEVRQPDGSQLGQNQTHAEAIRLRDDNTITSQASVDRMLDDMSYWNDVTRKTTEMVMSGEAQHVLLYNGQAFSTPADLKAYISETSPEVAAQRSADQKAWLSTRLTTLETTASVLAVEELTRAQETAYSGQDYTYIDPLTGAERKYSSAQLMGRNGIDAKKSAEDMIYAAAYMNASNELRDNQITQSKNMPDTEATAAIIDEQWQAAQNNVTYGIQHEGNILVEDKETKAYMSQFVPYAPYATSLSPTIEYVVGNLSASSADEPQAHVDYFTDAWKNGLSVYESDTEVSQRNTVDRFIETLAYNNVNSLQSFVDFLYENDYGDAMSLLSNVGNGAQANIINKAVTVDRATGLPALGPDGHVIIPESVDAYYWSQIQSILKENSGSYSSVASIDRIASANSASILLSLLRGGYKMSDQDISLLEPLIGETLISEMQMANAGLWDTVLADGDVLDDGAFAFVDQTDDDGNVILGDDGTPLRVLKTKSQSVRDWYTSLSPDQQQNEASFDDYLKAALANNAEIGANMLSEAENSFIDFVMQNMKYGISGLTKLQALSGVNTIRSAVDAGEQEDYIVNTDSSVYASYGSHFANLEGYLSYAQMMEDLGIAKVDSEGNPLTGEDAGVYTLNDLDSIEEGSAAYEAIDEALQQVGRSAEDAKKAVGDLGDEIAAVEKPYGKLTDEVQQNSKAWKGNKREVAAAFKTLNSTMSEIANNQYYREQYKAGKRDSKTIEAISAMTGFDKEIVKQQPELVGEMMDELVAADVETIQVKLSEFDQFLAQDDIAVQMPSIVGVGGSVDFAEAISRLSGESAAELQALASLLQQMGFTASIVAEQVGESVRYKILIDQMTGLGAGRKSGGGGGGGGSKKSAAQKLLEDQKREQTLWDHRRKMIQYQATRYENAGELTNYAIMLGHESKEIERQIKLREEQINQLKKQLATTKKYSDDWYEIRDAILSAEEALEDLINDNKELAVTIEEIEQKILELHIDLEKTVKDEIETRIQAERDMLSETVSMQDTILEAIRERYRTEWELMQEDLDRKREALEEEIALIDERLQRRKDAEDEAAKHEELAELKRQLALVSMDGSRTKDQKQLREQIEELERELAWDSAEDEAEMQKDALQEQADAYSDYEEEYQKYLDDLLEDANNFSDEVNRVMAMGQEDMLRWLSENVEEFRLSLDAAQKQMTQNWTDTFKQMKGIVDTYWAEIARTLSSKETFISYMKQSSTYQNASESEKAQLEHTWGKMYDDWLSAKKESEEAKDYEHQDPDDSADSSASTTRYRANYTLTWTGTDDDGNPVQMSHSGYGLGSSKYAAEGSAKIVAQNYIKSHGLSNVTATYNAAYKYAKGGLVDFTGLAWVDGTPSAPEAFLSATDTALVRSMLDAWQFIIHKPTISNVDSAIGHNAFGTSFGDVHIEITEASFADDADIEAVARRVGDAFTKELSKNGFRTASFNF